MREELEPAKDPGKEHLGKWRRWCLEISEESECPGREGAAASSSVLEGWR